MNTAIRRAAGLAARLCASCLILSTTLGQEYSWQVSGSYLDETAQSTATIQHRLLRATYYLFPVDGTVGPYELAPFLNRSSYVTVGADRTKIREETFLSIGADPGFGSSPLPAEPIGEPTRLYRFDGEVATVPPFPAESGQDTADYAVAGRYVWPGAGWYAGASARRGDFDAAPTLPFFRTTSKSRRTGVFAGRYSRRTAWR